MWMSAPGLAPARNTCLHRSTQTTRSSQALCLNLVRWVAILQPPPDRFGLRVSLLSCSRLLGGLNLELDAKWLVASVRFLYGCQLRPAGGAADAYGNFPRSSADESDQFASMRAHRQ